MRHFNIKYFVLLAGLLFATTVAIDPLHHEYTSHDSVEAECQFCENELNDISQSHVDVKDVSFLKVFKVEINEIFISNISKNFHSRAPPKS